MKQEFFQWSKGSQQYRITLSPIAQGFEIQAEDIKTRQTWLNNFPETFITEISQKAGKKVLPFQMFQILSTALRTQTNLDMMSAFELESLKIRRGGQPSTQNKKSNKKYLILTTPNNDQKVHYPLPLQFKDTVSLDELKQMIKALKGELQFAKEEQKTHSSISDILNTSSVGQNLKLQNEKMKQMIKEIEQQLSQKKGAVQLDQIIRQKNDLELRTETLKRQELKEITKLKSIYVMREKEVNDMKNEINLIRKQLDIGEEGNNTKLKSHIMRVVKVNQSQLNNAKKVIMKQQKQIANQTRNLQNAKQNQKKYLMKIKQIQTEIDQAKKKLNTKEISNRLYSPSGSKKSTSNAPSKPVPNRVVVGNLVKRTGTNISADNSSNASSTSKPRSYNGPVRSNLIRPTYNPPQRKISDPLTRTTPAMNTLGTKTTQRASGVINRFSPNRTTKPPIPSPVAPIRTSSPQERSASLNRLSQPRNPLVKPPQPKVPIQVNNYKPQPLRKPIQSQPKVPLKRQLTQKQKNIFSKIDEIRGKLSSSKKI